MKLPYYQGKTALVIGGTQGIGQAIAMEFLQRGARVAIASRGLSAPFPKLSIEAIPMDVTQSHSVEESFKVLARQNRVPDIVVVSAGLTRAGSADQLSEKDAEAQMETNLMGKFNVVRYLLPFWRAHPGTSPRHLVFVSSLAAEFAVPGYFVYGATMAAILHAARMLRIELAGEGIGVTALLPGDTDTPGLAAEHAASPPWVRLITETAEVMPPRLIAQDLLNRLPANPAEVIPHWKNRALVWVGRHFPALIDQDMRRRYRAARHTPAG